MYHALGAINQVRLMHHGSQCIERLYSHLMTSSVYACQTQIQLVAWALYT